MTHERLPVEVEQLRQEDVDGEGDAQEGGRDGEQRGVDAKAESDHCDFVVVEAHERLHLNSAKKNF